MSLLDKRPKAVTRLGTFVLILTSWHVYKLVVIAQNWELLEQFGFRLSPIYLAAEALVWTLTGSFLTWNLLARSKHYPKRLKLAVVLYVIARISKEGFLINLGISSANFKFEIALIIIIAFLVLWSANRRGTLLYFGELNERQQKD